MNSRFFKIIYREEIDDYSVKSFLVRFHFKRQFLNLEYRGKKNIIFVFPVLGFFMVKLSFEFCRAKCELPCKYLAPLSYELIYAVCLSFGHTTSNFMLLTSAPIGARK